MQTLAKIVDIIWQLIGVIFWAITCILTIFALVIFWGYVILCGSFVFFGDDN